MSTNKIFITKIVVILFLGICLGNGGTGSLFSWEIPSREFDVVTSSHMDLSEYQLHNQEIAYCDSIGQEYNREAIYSSQLFKELSNQQRTYDRGFSKNQLFLCTISKDLYSLIEISVFINRTVFQGVRNDLLIIDFIHQKDGKKEDTSCCN